MPVICEIAEHENLENSNLSLSENKETPPADKNVLQQPQTGAKKSQVTPKRVESNPKGSKTNVCCKGCTIF